MPTFSADTLLAFATRVLEAGGAPADIAGRVAFSLVDSNLKGVDSHGVGRIPSYLQQVADGQVDPAARTSVEQDRGATAIVRGHRAYGIYAIEVASDLAIERARAHGVATIGLIDASHAGRIGQFVAQIADQGLFALIIGGGSHQGWNTVAPFGGAKPVFSTNPFSFAMPGGEDEPPVVVDFATSATARGKIMVHAAKDQPVPEGWILDKEGRATTNPNDLFDGGMQLPAADHKGYGLALIAELLCFAVLKSAPVTPNDLNWMIMAFDINGLRPMADYQADSAALLDLVRNIPPAPGFERVLIPGDPERMTEAKRQIEGIALPDATWTALQETAAGLGVATDKMEPLT